MGITLPYGKTTLTVDLSPAWQVEVIEPYHTEAAHDPLSVVKRALHYPVGGVFLEDFDTAKTVAIAINDKTRPVPHDYLLPPLLEALGRAPERITFVIANGTHPPMQPAEYHAILPPELMELYRVVSHVADDENLYLGETSRGTPVSINRTFMAADLRIVVGNIEPHQFMGFSGGVKSVAVGLAGKATVNHNHSLMTDPTSTLGNYDTNAARQDVEEIGELIRVDFALNAILNAHKQIVDVVAGAPRAVMHSAIPKVRQIFQVEVGAAFDLVIASPGGHPKDLNLYQAQKALAHAAMITKPGGAVIMVAACPEGTGSASYENWMLQDGMDSYQAVFARFAAEGFQVGPHKAYQLAQDAARVRAILVSEMPPDLVKKLLLQPAASIEAALQLADLPAGAKVGVMPAANATIPLLVE